MRLAYYYFSFVLGLIFACAVNAYTAKKTDGEIKKSISSTVTGFVCAVLGAYIMAQIYNFAIAARYPGESFSQSNLALYGGLLFMPLFLLLPIKLIHADYGLTLDSCTPGVYMLLGVAKTGCAVYGCCYGVGFENGVVCPLTNERVFPIQLLETLVYLAVAVFMSLYIIKSKNRTKGAAYPAGLIIYGAARFCLQFLRAHEIAAECDFLWFMDFWQCVSLVAAATGTVWLIALKIKEREKN